HADWRRDLEGSGRSVQSSRQDQAHLSRQSTLFLASTAIHPYPSSLPLHACMRKRRCSSRTAALTICFRPVWIPTEYSPPSFLSSATHTPTRASLPASFLFPRYNPPCPCPSRQPRNPRRSPSSTSASAATARQSPTTEATPTMSVATQRRYPATALKIQADCSRRLPQTETQTRAGDPAHCVGAKA